MKKHILRASLVAVAAVAAVALGGFGGFGVLGNVDAGPVGMHAANAADMNNYAINKSVDGKFTIKADVGYIYNFASKWNGDFGGGNGTVNGAANSAVGYGASLGYTHQSGFGLSADYLGFNNKWNSGGNNYDASFHALTLTPSYRFALDRGNQWGLRLGLGVGLSLSDITWGSGGKTANALTTTNNPAGKMAGGAIYSSNPIPNNGFSACGVSAGGAGQIGVTRINDTIGNGSGAVDAINTCQLNGGVNPTAPITDNEIAKWLIKNSNARLGIFNSTDGFKNISQGVWTILLKAADGDSASITTLTNATTYDAGSITQEDARLAFVKLLGGWDGNTPPFGYETATTSITTNSYTSLGIPVGEARKLAAAGVNFAGGVPPAPASKAKDDAGFVLVPQVALEYDNGMFHGDINVRYIHALKNVKYDGTGDVMGKTYSINAGPAALFVGAGFGVNF